MCLELKKFRLTLHESAELLGGVGYLLCTLITFLNVDVEVALEAVDVGDWACIMHTELQLFDNQFLESNEFILGNILSRFSRQ